MDFEQLKDWINMDEEIPSDFNEILKDTHACTHIHSCNTSGPDFSHAHTCFHVHTDIRHAPSHEPTATDHDFTHTAEPNDNKSRKQPSRNREAVKRYRDKKKAEAASLEDEVVQLREENQQLKKWLWEQAVHEARTERLTRLLVDIRGRIEGEIGFFPHLRRANRADVIAGMVQPDLGGVYMMNSCNLCHDDLMICSHSDVGGTSGEPGPLNGQGFGFCDMGNFSYGGNY